MGLTEAEFRALFDEHHSLARLCRSSSSESD